MLVRYTPCPVRSGVPSLAGALIVPRPILAVHFIGPVSRSLRGGNSLSERGLRGAHYLMGR